MSATFNPVVRGDPNRMQRVGHSVMDGGFQRGNQRPHVRATNRPSAPALSVKQPLQSPRPEYPDEPEFVPLDARSPALLVEPPNRIVVRNRDSVRLAVARENVQDVEWRAYSPSTDDARQMRTGTVAFIEDRPIVDTMYEVSYRYVEQLRSRALQWHAERYYVLVRVVDDVSGGDNGVERPLEFSLIERAIDNQGVTFLFQLSNNSAQTLYDLEVQLQSPALSVFDPVASRRATPGEFSSAVRWQHYEVEDGPVVDNGRQETIGVPIAATHIDELPAHSAMRFAYSVRAKYVEADVHAMHIDRATVWSERENQIIPAISFAP